MSLLFHHSMAKTAIAQGRSSADFNNAAQKHANATWFFGIIAAIVYYNSSLGWALIPGLIALLTMIQSISATKLAIEIDKIIHQPEKKSDIKAIINAYGRVLETEAPLPGTVADANKLPYPKQQIKDAILKALSMTKNQEMREHLKTAYISLADWQENVGEANKRTHLSEADLNQDTQLLAKQVLANHKLNDELFTISQNERQTLEFELKNHVN